MDPAHPAPDLRIWDILSGDKLKTLCDEDSAAVNCLAVASDNDTFIGGTGKGKLR